jgi:acyl-CoA thioester hydrolase
MPAPFEIDLEVEEGHIDVVGHVGNRVFLDWLLEAAEAHSVAVGLSWERYRELGGVFVVRRHEIDYLGPAFQGDALVVRTWITRTTRVSSLRSYEILRDTKCLIRACTTWAFVSLESGRPRRIPKPVLEAFDIAPE